MRVAVLGLGNMGGALARLLLEKGHQVTVWNRSEGKADSLIAAGAVELRSPRGAVEGAELVMTSLSNDEAVRAVCLGDQGVVNAMAGGSILVDHSTVSPATSRELAEANPTIRVADAPFLGSPTMVGAGAAVLLVGGSEDTVAALKPIWADLSASQFHFGPSGSGSIMKIVSNLLLITGIGAMAEAIVTAQANGISDDLLREFLQESHVTSPSMRARLDNVIGGNHPGWFSTTLALKDLRLADDLASAGGVRLHLAPAAQEMLSAVIAAGRDGEDLAAIVEACRGATDPGGSDSHRTAEPQVR